MPNDYQSWYEAIRRSDKVGVEDLTELTAEEALREFDAKGDISEEQREAIREQMTEEDIEAANEENQVSTSRQSDLSEDSAFRPSGDNETVVETSKGAISTDRIDGTYEYQGNKYVRVDGKVYGKVVE